jgi:heme exporter protein A
MRLRISPSGAAFFFRIPPVTSAWSADRGVLAAENLACRRGERMIFSGLNCVVPPGGALLLTGANGSGKSSLLRLLATLLTAAAGRVTWGGTPIAADLSRYRASLHYVGHLDAIKPALAVRETVAFWAGIRGAAQPQIDRALATLGLEPLADWPCRWLSAGQRRRLALARLIAAPAPLWLLDEPTAALDSDSEQRLIETIETHRACGGRVVIATHQPMPLADAQNLLLEEFPPVAEDPLGDF